jgi:hypothetical protein
MTNTQTLPAQNRKAACDQGLPLRPVHPDQCNDDFGESIDHDASSADKDEEVSGDTGRRQEAEHPSQETGKNKNHHKLQHDRDDHESKKKESSSVPEALEESSSPGESPAKSSSFLPDSFSSSQSSCGPKDYDSMKEQVLLKSKYTPFFVCSCFFSSPNVIIFEA